MQEGSKIEREIKVWEEKVELGNENEESERRVRELLEHSVNDLIKFGAFKCTFLLQFTVMRSGQHKPYLEIFQLN